MKIWLTKPASRLGAGAWLSLEKINEYKNSEVAYGLQHVSYTPNTLQDIQQELDIAMYFV